MGEGETVLLNIPIKTISSSNSREHWARKARRVKAERSAAYMMMPNIKPPCVVTMTRVAPRRLDDDNLRGCLKAVRDGIAQRLGIDDADPVVEWRYAQESGKPKEYSVSIRVDGVSVGNSEVPV